MTTMRYHGHLLHAQDEGTWDDDDESYAQVEYFTDSAGQWYIWDWDLDAGYYLDISEEEYQNPFAAIPNRLRLQTTGRELMDGRRQVADIPHVWCRNDVAPGTLIPDFRPIPSTYQPP